MPAKKRKEETPASLNIRGFPRETLYRLKMAAAAEHRTVKDLLLELIDGKIQELEKKGQLPKGKLIISHCPPEEKDLFGDLNF